MTVDEFRAGHITGMSTTALTAEQLAIYGLFGGLCVTCGSPSSSPCGGRKVRGCAATR